MISFCLLAEHQSMEWLLQAFIPHLSVVRHFHGFGWSSVLGYGTRMVGFHVSFQGWCSLGRPRTGIPRACGSIAYWFLKNLYSFPTEWLFPVYI